MTAAQQRTLEQAGASDKPIKVPAPTAMVLLSSGYLEPAGDLWQITDKGRRILRVQRRREAFNAIDKGLSFGAREWGDRVAKWLVVHHRLGPEHHRYAAPYRYAAHVAAATFDAIEPALPEGDWTDGALRWVRAEARSAADCLRDYDAAREKARQRGVAVEVTYAAARGTPRSRSGAAQAAAIRDGVVSLSTYRDRRPQRRPA